MHLAILAEIWPPRFTTFFTCNRFPVTNHKNFDPKTIGKKLQRYQTSEHFLRGFLIARHSLVQSNLPHIIGKIFCFYSALYLCTCVPIFTHFQITVHGLCSLSLISVSCYIDSKCHNISALSVTCFSFLMVNIKLNCLLLIANCRPKEAYKHPNYIEKGGNWLAPLSVKRVICKMLPRDDRNIKRHFIFARPQLLYAISRVLTATDAIRNCLGITGIAEGTVSVLWFQSISLICHLSPKCCTWYLSDYNLKEYFSPYVLTCTLRSSNEAFHQRRRLQARVFFLCGHTIYAMLIPTGAHSSTILYFIWFCCVCFQAHFKACHIVNHP